MPRTDLGRATRFYSALVESEPVAVFDPPGMVFFRLGSVRLLLDRAAPSALIYLGVSDVEETVERCRTRGVEIATEPHVIFSHLDGALGPAGTDEWMAFLADWEGKCRGPGEPPTDEYAECDQYVRLSGTARRHNRASPGWKRTEYVISLI